MTLPMSSDDPTAGLFLPPGAGPVPPSKFRSGTVVAFNPLTGENVIKVDGVSLVNLPVSPGSYQWIIKENDKVTLDATTDGRGISTYLVTGLALTPPDARFAQIPPGGLASDNAYASPSSANTTTAAFTDIPFPTIGTMNIGISKRFAQTAIKLTMSMTAYSNSGTGGAFGGALVSWPNGATDNVELAGYIFNAVSDHRGFSGQRILRPTEYPSVAQRGSITARARWFSSGLTLTVDGGDRVSLTIEEVV